MPCDSIETSKVDFKNADSAFVVRALKSLGYEVRVEDDARTITATKAWGETVEFANGSLTIRSRSGVNAAQITRAYSTEVVKFAAEEYGWNFEQTGENEFSVEKASL